MIITPIYKKSDNNKPLVIIEEYFCYQRKNIIQHSYVTVNSICKGNYCGTALKIRAQYQNYCQIFHNYRHLRENGSMEYDVRT